MLKYIRQRSGGTLSVLIIAAIAIVFIFWGVGGQDSSNLTSISLDDAKVSLATFRETQRNVLERARQANPTVTKEMETASYRQALGVLLERHNLLKLAAKFNLKVSDAEVNKVVKNDPQFQENGRFSLNLYRDTVTKRYGQTLSSYESSIRESILLDLTTELLRGLAHPSKRQVLEEFHYAADKIALNFAQFNSSDYKEGIAPSAEDLNKYFAANQEKYRVPPEIKVQYVEVTSQRFFDQTQVSPTEIEEAYSLAQKDFTSPEKAEVSHILLMFPNLEELTDQAKAETLARAQAALERAQTEDFATLAKEISQDTSTVENGGELGEIERGQTFAAFDEAIFGQGVAALNKPLGPVESPLGYHVLLVRSHTPGGTKPLAEVTSELELNVKNRKARAEAANQIEELEKAARYPSTLADGAKALGLEVKETDFFNENAGAPDFLANQPPELQKAFRQEIGQLSFPTTSPNGYAIYAVTEKKDSFIPTLDDQATKEKVQADYVDQGALVLAKEAAANFLAQVTAKGWDAATSSAPKTAVVGQTPLFRRLSLFEAGEPFVYANVDGLLRNYATLSKPGQIGPEPVVIVNPDPSGYLAISLAKLEPADENDLTQPGSFSPASIRDRLKETFYSYWVYQANQEVELKMPPELRSFIEGRNS
ncbi:MAG: SurA N-terminal domain-containing protein [Deltaproteobacteria bacterium]|jgi:peptidyl-prolyl cis-trans isomerase D|nr:SurA N-terminal domain-containing protein [Deltaproteobacteria bacterium]